MVTNDQNHSSMNLFLLYCHNEHDTPTSYLTLGHGHDHGHGHGNCHGHGHGHGHSHGVFILATSS